ncbi:MAG: L-serine dehydratase 1 [Chthoniobacteraceae bacterium]|nr:L-serine dehydratase 1 [Chthoniobacteraceae bacterium]
MHLSALELFTIGIGPSSSHTVGPMRAARRFVRQLAATNDLARTAQVNVHFYGSLGATGKGHGSDKAAILGLLGHTPEVIPVDQIPTLLEEVRATGLLLLNGTKPVRFAEKTDLVFLHSETLPYHPNAMRLTALDETGELVRHAIYYSIGGGFIVCEDEINKPAETVNPPFGYQDAAELLRLCNEQNLSISELTLQNEAAWRSEAETWQRLQSVWETMQACVQKGCQTAGILPGGLKVKRRAHALHQQLTARPADTSRDSLSALDWVNLYALAVNEENAGGGRVVTAPTNGAAGIIPAVMHYADRFCPPNPRPGGILRFLLTAGAIGILFKKNASISGADVGCQGEVGVACSMAAAALCEHLGGAPGQVENAAEIGMEHNLGLTCDPIGGLVQIPCIERNAMGSVGAINAARLALRGKGDHFVSLDKVIKTMRETGRDMNSKYKETSRGGLAVNMVEC